MSEPIKPFVVIHPGAFGPAKDLRAAVRDLKKAGYVVVVGDPSAIKSVDVIAIAAVSAISRAAFEVIAEHDNTSVGTTRAKFGLKVCKILMAPPPTPPIPGSAP